MNLGGRLGFGAGGTKTRQEKRSVDGYVSIFWAGFRSTCAKYNRTYNQREQLPMKLSETKMKGFTLIEVLLALAIIAIALTALLKVTAHNIETTKRIKEKNISHWVGMQAVAMLQLNLIEVNANEESTQTTSMLGEQWYWRAKIVSTPIKGVSQILISLSNKQSGPFYTELTAYKLSQNASPKE